MKKKYQVIRLFLLIYFFCGCSVSVIADPEIPLLGENASLNLSKEAELGRGLYERLKEKGYVITEPMLSRYLQDIGDSLLSTLDVRVRDYRFYLVKDSSINAFAAPGGYIGINMGLIEVAKTEDELAAVLAHEIAHVELMHSMQLIEKSKNANVVSMISILAAILISSQDVEAANALIYTGIAGSAQSVINFTRANEYEADRVGIEILKKSDYNPQAMADFMKILQSREQGGELAGIEYLRTHPVNSNRIAEITSRISSNKRKQLKKTRYQQFKDYLFYLYPDRNGNKNQTRFSLALEFTRNGQYENADIIFQQLLNNDPDSLWFSYAMAENLEYQKKLDKAGELYRSALLLYPDDMAISSRLVHLYLVQGKLKKALNLTSQLIRKYRQNPELYQLFVDIYSRLGNDTLRQLSEANYHWFSGNRKQAIKMYKILVSKGLLDPVNEQLVKEKLNTD